MTEDKNFKIKVREVAELNGLTYTEAKKSIIELNKYIDNLDDETKEFLSREVELGITRFTAFNFMVEEPYDDKFVHYDDYEGIPQYVKLSFEGKSDRIDFSPLNNGVQIGVKNTAEKRCLYISNDSFRLCYSVFAEQFDNKNTYFVDSENYFSQMPKVIRNLEKIENYEEVLLGVMSPCYGSNNKETTKQRLIVDKFESQIKSLVSKKKIYVITDSSSLTFDPINTINASFSELLEKQIRYYPFDKTHGGSYHRTTNKQILGHNNGETKFLSSKMTLIENDDSSCIDRIYTMNKDKADFVQWNTREDMNKSLSTGEMQSTEELFLKIGFEMNTEELGSFLNHLDNRGFHRFYANNEEQKVSDKDQIVIESPDAEIIQSYYEDKSAKTSAYIDKYTLVDGNLYSEKGEKFSLYKTDVN